VLAEDIFDATVAPPCTPAGDVVACVGGHADIKLGGSVAPLLLEQRLPEVVVRCLVRVVVLLYR
jgi:hypothetical protein